MTDPEVQKTNRTFETWKIVYSPMNKALGLVGRYVLIIYSFIILFTYKILVYILMYILIYTSFILYINTNILLIHNTFFLNIYIIFHVCMCAYLYIHDKYTVHTYSV